MFGYVIARKDTLSEEQLARYRGCYCGLCNALKTHFGSLHRLALNYDMTFLILLLSSLYEPEEQAGAARCAVHPAKPQDYWQNDLSAYAADLTIALTWHKLRDDWLDEGDRLKKGLMDQLQGAYEQAKSRLPRQCAVIERELEELLQRQHMEMQTESINALEQNYRQQRRVTHEFEHHLQVLDNLLTNGAVMDAQDYIRQLRSSRSYRTISVNSRHSVIDVILNQKYQTAKESGIKMQLQVNDLSGVTVLTQSLVVILSNLLDNAIEACRRLDGYREIDCSVLCDDSLYIAIRNTSYPVRIENGQIATSKGDDMNHGYGLGNVCYLVDKLGGEYTFEYEDGWFQFVAEIPDE